MFFKCTLEKQHFLGVLGGNRAQGLQALDFAVKAAAVFHGCPEEIRDSGEEGLPHTALKPICCFVWGNILEKMYSEFV